MREKNNMDLSFYYFKIKCNMRVNWNKPAGFAGHQVSKRDAKRQKRFGGREDVKILQSFGKPKLA